VNCNGVFQKSGNCNGYNPKNPKKSSVRTVFFFSFCLQGERTVCLVCLGLSAESASHLIVFFFHNKLVNNTFCHGLSAKRTRRQ
jgi:hypothetical protein